MEVPFYTLIVASLSVIGVSGQEHCAKLYRHGFSTVRADVLFVYSGTKVDLKAAFNNAVSSIKIQPGCTLMAYKQSNYGEFMFKATSDMSELDSTDNDKISSVKCFCECTNKMQDSLCIQWKNSGFCTNAKLPFVVPNCRKACGFCVNVYERIEGKYCSAYRTKHYGTDIDAKLACDQDSECHGYFDNCGTYFLLCDGPISEKTHSCGPILYRKEA